MTGIALHIDAGSPAQVFVDFFGFARNFGIVSTGAFDACLGICALRFTVAAVFRRSIEIGTFIVAELEVV